MIPHATSRAVERRTSSSLIDGAKIALGHAYCGGSQYYAMWVVGAEEP